MQYDLLCVMSAQYAVKLLKKKRSRIQGVKVKAKANQMHTVFLTHTKNTHINLEILCAQQEVNFNGIKPQ